MKSKSASGGFWLAPTIISNEPFRYLLLFACLLAFPAARAQTFLTGTEGFESGSDGWTTDNSAVWQVGVPTSGPGAAFAGTNCASLVLTHGNYQANADSRLISPLAIVPAANQSPRLRFWHWYSIGGGDHATVEIKPLSSSTWTTLSADYGDIGNLNNVCGGGGVWTRPSLDLSRFAGQSVQIAFHFVSDYGSAVAPNAGWFVDDVALVTGTPVFNNPEGFESGLGDWSVDRGTWQVGVPTSGPRAAFSGTNCARLAVTGGDYQANVDSRFISPPLAVPAANQSPRLHFWHWYSIGGGDHATVEIKPLSSSTWTTLSADYGDIGNLNNVNNSGGVWTRPSLDLSRFAGQSVQIAFHFISDGGSAVAPNAGWFVDDVALVTGTPVFNNPEGFESGLGDWSVDRGTWQVGVPTSGPRAAFSGTNCASLAVTGGDYQANVDSRFISPPLAVPAANQSPRLRFWHWYSIGGGNHATVEIKPLSSSTWTTLSADYGDIGNLNNVCGGGGVWTRPSLDLSRFAGQSVQIAFHFVSDGGSAVAPNAGWFVDDVALVTGTPVFNNPEGFESGLGDWSVDRGTWQVGVPTSGPRAAFSGTNCASLAVTGGDYQANVDSRFISPPLAVPAANQSPRLRFWHWYSIGGGDHATVEIKPLSSSTWTTLSADYGDIGNLNNVCGGGGVWTRPSLDLSQFAGQSVQIAFHFVSDGGSAAAPNAGWFVDDVALVTGTPVFNNPEGFESGLGDWSVDRGTWQVGVPTSGPGAAFSGNNCASLAVTGGDYQANVDSRLISPPLAVPAANQSPRLRFSHWYSIGGGDHATVEIKPLSSRTWTTLSADYGDIGNLNNVNNSGGVWTRPSINLSQFAGLSVQIAFHFISDGGSAVAPNAGWFVDNIELRSGPDIFNNPETFELGWGDWSTDNDRLWQIGVPAFGPPKNAFGLRAYAGTNVAATILNGNYPDGVSSRLISPSFTVPSVDPSSAVLLRFWQWYQYGTGDAGLVQIAPVASPTNWTTLTVAATNGTSTIWTQVVVDLTAYQGQQVRLGFYHIANSDGSVGAGWYLDNVGFSSFVPTPLTFGQPFTNFFTANGQYQYFILQVPPGGHLLVNLNALGATGANELYLSRGHLPTPGSYDYRFSVNGAANQTVFAPDAGAGAWYVLAYNATGAVPETYTLTAQFLTGIVIQSVNPTVTGNSIPGTVVISGAGFTPDDAVTLVNGAQSYPSSNVSVISDTQIQADFDFTAVPTNSYSLTVASGTNSASIPFSVISGGVAGLQTQLILPSRMGYHVPATIYVQYSNTGQVAVLAPLLTLTGEQNGLQKALLTLDSSKVGLGFWTTAIPQGFANTVQFLGNGSVPGLLQPGDSVTVPVYYAGWQQPWNFGYPPFQYTVGVLTVTNTTPVGWDSLKSGMQPPSISDEVWDVLWSNFTKSAGVTWGDYVRMLDSDSLYLNRLGDTVNGVSDLLSFEFAKADGLNVVHNLASAMDAYMPTPGLGLSFSRVFLQNISQRYALGALGRGWSHNWDFTASVASDGTATIKGPAGSLRVFQPDSRGGYFSQTGDHGV